ncbi:MAG TPA: hypothetical protein VM869_30720 [Enhygromyxa sp.]|nr:hypothetical protein [Enhygromyxa sp.]
MVWTISDLIGGSLEMVWTISDLIGGSSEMVWTISDLVLGKIQMVWTISAAPEISFEMLCCADSAHAQAQLELELVGAAREAGPVDPP